MEYNPESPNLYKNWVRKQESLQVQYEKRLKRRSKVAVLMDMVDEFDEECEDDVRDEAKKFGKVSDFAVFFNENSNVWIYVLFDDEVSAELFVKTMDGRFYSGKQITAGFYCEQEFLANRLGQMEFFIAKDEEKSLNRDLRNN